MMTEDKKFGLALTLALAIISGLACWRGHQAVSLGFLVAGVVTLVALLAAPGLMRYPRAGLRAVGWVNGRLIMILVFYLVFTPAGLLMRIFRKDPLDRNWDKNLSSYWIPRETAEYDPGSTERQY